jgi:hypothetical protein
MSDQLWIEHDGGECPVDPNSRPDMIFMNEATGKLWLSLAANTRPKWKAGNADWSKCLRYRPDPLYEAVK